MQDPKEIINAVTEHSLRNTPVVPTTGHLVRTGFLTAAFALALTGPFLLYRLRTGACRAARVPWNLHGTIVVPTSPGDCVKLDSTYENLSTWYCPGKLPKMFISRIIMKVMKTHPFLDLLRKPGYESCLLCQVAHALLPASIKSHSLTSASFTTEIGAALPSSFHFLCAQPTAQQSLLPLPS